MSQLDDDVALLLDARDARSLDYLLRGAVIRNSSLASARAEAFYRLGSAVTARVSELQDARGPA